MIITISDCLKRLETGEVATLEFWTYDQKRNKGGVVEIMTCILLQKSQNPNPGSPSVFFSTSEKKHPISEKTIPDLCG
jgi:hypothetical protein